MVKWINLAVLKETFFFNWKILDHYFLLFTFAYLSELYFVLLDVFYVDVLIICEHVK